MTNKVSKRLVIDASVARAAGGETATNPTSQNCRAFLEAVLNICHKLVMTPEIKDEWNKHQSSYTITWRKLMLSRKKFEFIKLDVNDDLWKQLESLSVGDKEREAMLKDVLLIEAALATDKTIISLDEKTARKLFKRAACQVDELKDIVWVNPDKLEENPIKWLENGAPPENERLLGTF